MTEEMEKKKRELQDVLFQCPDWMVESIIEAAFRKAKNLMNLQKKAGKRFANACEMVKAKEFHDAFREFERVSEIRAKIGDKIGAKIARALSFESMIRSLMKTQQIYFLSSFYHSSFWAENALTLYEEMDDQKGIGRIKALMNEFEQLEEEDNERFWTAEFLENEAKKDLEFTKQFLEITEGRNCYGQKLTEIFALLVYIRSVSDRAWYSVFLERN